MNGLAKFDESILTEPEQRHFERQANRFRDLQCALNKQTAETVGAMGEILIDAQDRLANHGNGTFLAWAEATLGIGRSAVYRAIQSYRFLKDCPHVGKNFQPRALEVIAVSSCPEPARDEALKLANSGNLVTHKMATGLVAKHKPNPANDFPPGYSPSGMPSRTNRKKQRRVDPIDTSPKRVEIADENRHDDLFPDAGEMVEGETIRDSRIVHSEPEDLPSIDQAASALILAINREPEDSPIRTACQRLASRILDMVATGEPEPVVKESLTTDAAPEKSDVLSSIRKAGEAIDRYAATDEGRHVILTRAHQHLHGAKQAVAGGSQVHVLAEDVTMPVELDTPECREALSEWLIYKRKRGGAYGTVAGVEKQMNRFAEDGPEKVIAAIEYSIAQNYQGIHSDRTAANSRPKQFAGIEQWLDEEGPI